MSEPAAAPRLSLGVKLTYGLGSVAQGVGGVALSTALINFYLVVVVGLRPAVVGAVILISLVIDAFVDPLIGRFSDTFHSPWGRRHPFMYASALPIALAIAFLWRRPDGLSHDAMVVYVLAMLITVRLAGGLYQIPSDALVPELAPDYHERTTLLSYRWFFGIIGLAVMAYVMQAVFLRKDAAHPLGQYDPKAYAAFGLTAGIVVFAAILISSAATHRYIPTLSRPPVERRSFSASLREMAATLANPALAVVMISGLFSGVAGGLSGSLEAFMRYYFWGLTPQVAAVIGAFVAPAAIVGIVLAPWASRRFDKKRTMMAVFFLSIFAGVIPPVLRLTGVLAIGSPLIVPILIVDGFVAGALALMGFVIIGSMVADVAEDAAVKTGVRSEGLLFATNGLLPKITNGLGIVAGNLMLEAAHVPVGAAAATAGLVASPVMRHLVLMSLPTGVVLNMIAVSVLVFYRIDRGAHEANLEALRLAAMIGDPPTALATEPTPPPLGV
jgi:glycoside/pentoside/hexuronide:cation symporter, GPH family